MSDSKAFNAFLSYSHAADGRFAPAVQAALQRPAKPFYRLRAIRIFRDRTTLQLTPTIWPQIQQALCESQYFILLASPDAPQSEWVEKEIEEWLRIQNDRHRRVFRRFDEQAIRVDLGEPVRY